MKSKAIQTEIKAMKVHSNKVSLSANQYALLFFAVLTVIALIVA